ncbi:MAG: hypothetical protein HY897_12300 [Deltaproteobacteria bacterium]|nr:hypothetical protein [Deltaproteobacteria bacterium]
MDKKNKRANQTVGNAGLYYVCFKLSQMGWNVLPTSRNARGVDIVAYNEDATRYVTIQVKSLSKSNPVPFGRSTDNLIADFVVVCRGVMDGEPHCFILTPGEVRNYANEFGSGNKRNCFLRPQCYELGRFRENWERIRKRAADRGGRSRDS